MNVKVGDEVVIHNAAVVVNDRVTSGTAHGVVVKVGCKYFSATHDGWYGDYPTDYEIETGRERNLRPKYTQNNPSYAYTREMYAAKQLRAGISRRLRCVHKLDFGYAGGFGVDGSRLSIEALEAILAILDAERNRLATE